MKMKKILAAGVAATLAVSSMAAVASANLITDTTDATGNTRTFDMARTWGKYTLKESITQDKFADGLDLGEKYYLTDEEWTRGERLVNVLSNAILYDADVIAAAAAVDTAQKSIDDLKAILNANQAGTAANSAVVAAQAAVDAAAKTVETKTSAVVTATKALADATAEQIIAGDDNATAAAKVEAAQTALDTAQAELDDANTALDEANDALDEAKTNEDYVAYQSVQKLVEDAEKDLETASVAYLAAVANVETKPTTFRNRIAADAYSKTAYADSLTITIPELLHDAVKNSSGNYFTGAIVLKVHGVKGTRTATARDYEYPLTYIGNDVYGNPQFRLYIYADVAPTGGFLPEQFLEITNISLGQAGDYTLTSFTRADTGVTWITSRIDKEAYDLLGVKDSAVLTAGTGLDGAWGYWTPGNFTDATVAAAKGEVADLVAHFGAGTTAWPWPATYAAYITDIANDAAIFDEIFRLFADINGGWYAYQGDKSTYEEYAFLPRTTAVEGATIYRNDVLLLSNTAAYASLSAADHTGAIQNDFNSLSWWYEENDGTVSIVPTISGQSYLNSNHFGTLPNAFAGLASQAADFFNKYYNGKITFNIGLAATTSIDAAWKYGGVPSTEVGIKNMLSSAQTNDFALFFNYGSTTGTLQAATDIDANNGAVIFDISDVLDALDGHTIGTIQDIYYGMNKSLYNYSSSLAVPGMFITSIEFQRSDANDVDADVDEPEDDTTDVEPEVPVDDVDEPADVDDYDDADDEDEPADVDDDYDDYDDTDDTDDADDEDDAPYVEPDDEDDAPAYIDDTTPDDVAGDDIVPVVINNDPAGDENPGTGVALAVVPAIVAAAAMVVSKKRK